MQSLATFYDAEPLNNDLILTGTKFLFHM